MRPRIMLSKGEKPVVPPMNPSLSPSRGSRAAPPLPVTQPRATPKTTDGFMDKVVDVKNPAGQIIFTGTPRQWQARAHKREVAERLSYGLPATPRGR